MQLHRIITKFKISGQGDVDGDGDGAAVGLRKLTFKGDYDEKLTDELRGLLRPDGHLVLEVSHAPARSGALDPWHS